MRNTILPICHRQAVDFDQIFDFFEPKPTVSHLVSTSGPLMPQILPFQDLRCCFRTHFTQSSIFIWVQNRLSTSNPWLQAFCRRKFDQSRPKSAWKRAPFSTAYLSLQSVVFLVNPAPPRFIAFEKKIIRSRKFFRPATRSKNLDRAGVKN